MQSTGDIILINYHIDVILAGLASNPDKAD
jgi:hypothetical protein